MWCFKQESFVYKVVAANQ